MNATTLTAAALLLVATTGCTGSSGDDGAASEADVARYQQLARQVQSAAGGYYSQMMGQAGMDAAMCQYVHEQYYGQAWPWAFEMHQEASNLDETVHVHGGVNADYACVSERMWEEFDHHHSVACTWSGPSENLAEVQRHVEVMASAAGHLQDRCDQLMVALDGTTPDWGPPMASCEEESDVDECAMHHGMMHGDVMHDEDCD